MKKGRRYREVILDWWFFNVWKSVKTLKSRVLIYFYEFEEVDRA